ncbi:hypothetical protein FB451DRAFT_1163931 [Mycena latifolia]|nr:hypothetical protein FB451DRAFT_1163931 [Mycena latifolia]
MSHKRVRTKKIRNPSAHSAQTLGEEVAAVGANLNTLVEDTVGWDLLRGVQDVHRREDSPPGHQASDLDLAAKWGLPHDVVQAAEGRRVTRGSRSTMPKRLEMSRPSSGAVDDSAANKRLEVSLKEIDASAAGLEVSRKVDASAVVRLEVSRKVDASAAIQSPVMHDAAGSANDDSGDKTVVLSAIGELPWGNLPAVDRNVLQASHAPHVLRYELEEYMQLFQSQYDGDSEDSEDSTDTDMILAPVHTWDNNWTIATNKHGVRLDSGNKLNMNQLTVKPKFFPEWFDMSDEEESSVPQNAPELPNIQRIDLSILEDIIQDMSDDEDILELLSEYCAPVVHYTEDQQVQAAIIESLKDPKASSLGAERRAGSSTLKVGALIVKLESDDEPIASTTPQGSYGSGGAGPAPKDKGKSVDSGEKGADYDKLHHKGKAREAKKVKKSVKGTGKAQENHLRPGHFKRDQSEIPDGGWFRATTVGPDGPPSPPSSSSSSSDDSSSSDSSDSSSSSSDESSSSLSSAARRRKRTPLAKQTSAKKEHRKMKKPEHKQWGTKNKFDGPKKFNSGSGKPSTQTQAQQGASKTTNNSGNNSSKNGSSSKKKEQTNKLSKEERDRLRAEGRCFNCRDIGHESRNCPDRQTAKGPTLKAGSVKFSGLDGRATAAREANLRVGAVSISTPELATEGEWSRAHSEDAGRYLVTMLESYYQTDPSAERFSVIDYGDAFEVTDWEKPEKPFMVSRDELDDPHWDVPVMLAKAEKSETGSEIKSGAFPSMGEADNEYPAIDWLRVRFSFAMDTRPWADITPEERVTVEPHELGYQVNILGTGICIVVTHREIKDPEFDPGSILDVQWQDLEILNEHLDEQFGEPTRRLDGTTDQAAN